jgi:hypothetical protein
VAQWVFTSAGREGEQVGAQGWPGGLRGESRNILVGLVELRDGLESDELFGSDVEAVSLALNCVEQPGSWVAEFSQQRGG